MISGSHHMPCMRWVRVGGAALSGQRLYAPVVYTSRAIVARCCRHPSLEQIRKVQQERSTAVGCVTMSRYLISKFGSNKSRSVHWSAFFSHFFSIRRERTDRWTGLSLQSFNQEQQQPTQTTRRWSVLRIPCRPRHLTSDLDSKKSSPAWPKA